MTISKRFSSRKQRAALRAWDDRTVDVVVIGSGAAGLSAAARAASDGLSVVVLEKAEYLGGTSAISGGWAWVPGGPAGEREGDTAESIRDYVRALAGDAHDEARLTTYLDTVPRALTFLSQEVGLDIVDDATAPDYQQEAPGAMSRGRAVTFGRADARVLETDRLRLRPYHYPLTVFGYMPAIGSDLSAFVKANRSPRAFGYVAKTLLKHWAEVAVHRQSPTRTNGSALMTQLIAACRRLDIPMLTGAGVTSLIRDASARVTGVIVNRRVQITARRGVILAAGGFGGDEQTRAEVFGHDGGGTGHHTVTQGHTGDSLRLAREAGGVLDARPHSPAAWAPVTVWRNLRGRKQVFAHLRAFGLPGLIAVNEEGRRFGNESLSYHDFGRSMLEHARRPDGTVGAWIIGDRAAMRRYGIGYAKPWPVPTWYYERVGYLVRANSLVELAWRIGVPANALTETVRTFNAGADRGEDPAFGRGSSWYHTFKGDPDHKPNPNLAPLTRAPYYAVRLGLGDLGTFAGLDVDEFSRVRSADGDPVPGLYAVGSAAVSPFMGGYPGYGACIGPALVFGYQAAGHLCDSRPTSPATQDAGPLSTAG